MLDHHIQREIHHRLSHTKSLRFSELQPEGIENKLFDYHLKKTLSSGLIEKNDDGSYSLSATGRRIGPETLKDVKTAVDKAYSLLLIAMRHPDGTWLLLRRTTFPQIDKVGFLQVKPVAGRPVLDQATEYLLGLGISSPTVHVHAHGYLTALDPQEAVESFVHFTLLRAEYAALPPQLPEGYTWVKQSDFKSHDMLASTNVLLKLLEAPAGGFVDSTFQLS